jgi:hypothetical protein
VSSEPQPPGIDATLVEELARRVERDQEVRTDDGPLTDERLAEWAAVDRDNTAWLMATIDRHGWPGRALVGDTGAEHAWLLAQHADHDPDFQQHCLDLLTDAVARGDASPINLAYLTDRVRRANDQPQLYGTQYEPAPDGGWQPQPIQDADHVNERRAAIGMNPIEDDELHRS